MEILGAAPNQRSPVEHNLGRQSMAARDSIATRLISAARGRGQALRADTEARAADLRPVIDDMHERGIVSLNALAGVLNGGGFVTARGGKWYAATLQNLVARLGTHLI